jgi:hypothetical protein
MDMIENSREEQHASQTRRLESRAIRMREFRGSGEDIGKRERKQYKRDEGRGRERRRKARVTPGD